MSDYSYDVDWDRKSLITLGDMLQILTAQTEEKRAIITVKVLLKCFATKDGEFLESHEIKKVPIHIAVELAKKISNEVNIANLINEMPHEL